MQGTRIQSLQKQHEKLLHLADSVEKMLESVSNNVFAEHVKGLKGLRSIQHDFSSIVKHCEVDRATLESAYYYSLQDEERARIEAEHADIIQALTSFREEFKCATTDRTMALILPGMDLVNRLRNHILYERELLDRIAPLRNTQSTIARKRQKLHRTLRTESKHTQTRKRRNAVRATYTPYTLEPHPEL